MTEFLEVAKEAAREAGELIQSYLGKKHTENVKRNSSDFATEADLAAEKIIIDLITKHFPKHNIIAEENGQNHKGSEYTWVIDPLDGTVSFSTGIPTYCVSIALLYKNKPIVGVINHLALKELYWAVEEKGAFLNGEKIHVSDVSVLEYAVMNFDCGHLDTRQDKYEKYLFPLMNKVRYAYSLGSAATSMAMVAKGALDGDPNSAYIWDFAAAAIILTEAGGKVTDLEGKEPDWSKKRLDLVASNGLIHDAILEALKNSDKSQESRV